MLRIGPVFALAILALLVMGPAAALAQKPRETDKTDAPAPKSHDGDVTHLAFSPDGRILASASDDRSIRLWDPANGLLIRRIAIPEKQNGLGEIAFTPDGRLLAAGNTPRRRKSEGTAIHFYDVAAGRIAHVLDARPGWAWRLAFSPGGHRLASVGRGSDDTVMVWSVAERRLVRRIKVSEKDVAYDADFSPDGRLLATAEGAGKRRRHAKHVRIWNVETGRHIRNLPGQPASITVVAFSPDGHHLAYAAAGRLRLWDLGGRRIVRKWTAHEGALIESFRFSPSGEKIVTVGGFKEGEARVWDVASGRRLMTLAADSRLAQDAAWSPDGRWLATGGGDGLVKLWDAASGRLLRTMGVDGR